MTKVGIVVPDRGDRPEFLERCRLMVGRQTRQADYVCFMDLPLPTIDYIDIVHRYHAGFMELFNGQGVDCVVCVESDDWYAHNYVETMVTEWEKAGKPDVFGISQTVYYHIRERKWSLFKHPGRASMMSMLVGPKVLDHQFNYRDPYLDLALWGNPMFSKGTFIPSRHICVGIKHGYGMVGGGGHQINWPKYINRDDNGKVLEGICGQDAAFYKIIGVKDNYEITIDHKCDNPFLSIITRCHGDRRPKGLTRNLESVLQLKGAWEQIFIKDHKGMGLHMANCAFMLASDKVRGEYVFLLDDDNVIVNADMIPELEKVADEHDPDIVVFRMTIRNGAFNNHYPSPQCWQEQKPMLAHIGGSCMVVKREIFKKHIHHFGHARFGDFQFLNYLYTKEKYKWHWLDVLMADTYDKPGHGKRE